MNEWFVDWFGSEYLDLYAHRSNDEANMQVEEVLARFRILRAQLPKLALDIGCGRGRHLHALARRKVCCVGVDRSHEALKQAVRALQDYSSPCVAVEGDMRHLPVASDSFDLVSAFFTTFGYLASDAEHVALLREWARALKPDGVLFLDYLNPKRVRDTLVPESRKETASAIYDESRTFSPDGLRVEKRIKVTDRGTGKTSVYTESVRLYAREDIESLLEKSGQRIVHVQGDFGTVDWSPDAPRLLVWAERSK